MLHHGFYRSYQLSVTTSFIVFGPLGWFGEKRSRKLDVLLIGAWNAPIWL